MTAQVPFSLRGRNPDVLTWESLPESFQREAATLAPSFRARHDPARLLAEWERLLATVATSGTKTP